MGDIAKYTTKWFKKTFEGEAEEFFIMHMPDDEYSRVMESCSVHNEEGKDNIDIDMFNETILDKSLRDWKGMRKNGKGVKCTIENKRLLMTNKPDRVLYIVKTARDPVAFSDDYELIKKKLEELLSGNGGVNLTNDSTEAVPSA